MSSPQLNNLQHVLKNLGSRIDSPEFGGATNLVNNLVSGVGQPFAETQNGGLHRIDLGLRNRLG